jgi:predicted nucleic acid-binding protein
LIFIDSSFFIAGLIERDSRHETAVRLSELVQGRQLITTNHVRGETWTWICKKARHPLAIQMLDGLDDPNGHIRVDRVSEELEKEALHWLRRHDERVYSFVDATSFAYMRARRITDALAFDGDFAAAGFNELRP